ncbi:MAG: helix-turn-helix domain-containing protein [Xanthobacteraceae bacterium]
MVTFTDPELSPAEVELLITTAGKYHSALTEIKLHRLSVQRGRERLSRVANATVRAGRSSLYFLAGSHQATTRHSGRVWALGEIVASASGSTHHLRTDGPRHWATLSMRRNELSAAAIALVGRDLIEPSITQYFRPPLPIMSRLLNLHQAAEKLSERAASVIALPEPARAFEQALLHATIMCLNGSSTPARMTGGALRHTTIIARFEELLAANYDRPLHIPEICAAIGASERTLRVSCLEHVGMGPVRYLWLRRMHLARRSFILADAATSTVTTIATANGFGELGRFAVEYRALFGEAPSATLRRAAQEMRNTQTNPFIFADTGFA